MKKPLAALLVSAATVATLAVPAGAAPSKDWTVQTIPCRIGHKSAVFGYSPTHPYWISDSTSNGTRNPSGWLAWYKNPCPGQWLVFNTWGGAASEDSTTVWSVETGTAGKVAEVGFTVAHLADAPFCDVGGASYNIVVPKGRPPVTCP